MSWVLPSMILVLQYLQTIAVKKEMREKLQEIIDKLAAIAPVVIVPPGVPPPPTVIVIEPRRNNRYHIFDLDLTAAHVDEPVGVKELVEGLGAKFATFMTVLKLPGALTYKINAKEAPSCDAVVGDEWEEFEIEEIYYSNTAQAVADARVHVEFRVD